MFEILSWLLVKHWLADFPLQRSPYLYLHKGTYLHPGGIFHSLIHGVLTLVVLLSFSIDVVAAWMLALMDFLLHYHIDYFKVTVTKAFKWSAFKNNHLEIYSQNYFDAIGVDQLAHNLVYVLIVLSIR